MQEFYSTLPLIIMSVLFMEHLKIYYDRIFLFYHEQLKNNEILCDKHLF